MCLHICWPRPAASGCSKHPGSSSGTHGVCVSTGAPNQLQVYGQHAQPSTAHASCPAATCSAGTQMSGICAQEEMLESKVNWRHLKCMKDITSQIMKYLNWINQAGFLEHNTVFLW